jgi:hypothetical protein
LIKSRIVTVNDRGFDRYFHQQHGFDFADTIRTVAG